ncbi:chaperone modulator CbpM [Flavobacterium sp.]|uniref:chaperone modulator CbpM n=1 Tax=Flavobacterium sp. TaxID=239 RepID=UPI002BBC2542|nr:chaperone modulator CbpM [Flavobacterium sp.]HSD06170.1 chaperone modulator CbpM [Flavobacterium sp.]
MKNDNWILLQTISSHYKVELSFFTYLQELGLIEIKIIEQSPYIHSDQIYILERIIRIHQQLDVNPEGIDIVLNLLQKIEHLQKDLIAAQNRLRLYETA